MALDLMRPGDELAGYRVDDIVGIGGMAVVYRAEQVSLGRAVALKVLSPQLSRDADFRERFRREARHAAALEHPNIVPVYDQGEADDQLYIAMRLIEGDTLAERMRDPGLNADQAIALLEPIARALDAAHAAGIIHRDVKPQNILVAANGQPFLADFGVAKTAAAHGLTATGGFVGSIHYASPEQIRGDTLTPASDIYAFTAVLYQCLTGTVPFPRGTEAGVMHAHLSEPPPRLSTRNADVPPPLDRVVARGMGKDPQWRFGSAGALMAEAARLVEQTPRAVRRRIPSFPVEGAEPAAPETDPGTSPTPVPSRTHADRPRAAEPPPPGETRYDQRRPAIPEPQPTAPGPPGKRPPPPPPWKPPEPDGGGPGRGVWIAVGCLFLLFVVAGGIVYAMTRSATGSSSTPAANVSTQNPVDRQPTATTPPPDTTAQTVTTVTVAVTTTTPTGTTITPRVTTVLSLPKLPPVHVTHRNLWTARLPSTDGWSIAKEVHDGEQHITKVYGPGGAQIWIVATPHATPEFPYPKLGIVPKLRAVAHGTVRSYTFTGGDTKPCKTGTCVDNQLDVGAGGIAVLGGATRQARLLANRIISDITPKFGD